MILIGSSPHWTEIPTEELVCSLVHLSSFSQCMPKRLFCCGDSFCFIGRKCSMNWFKNQIRFRFKLRPDEHDQATLRRACFSLFGTSAFVIPFEADKINQVFAFGLHLFCSFMTPVRPRFLFSPHTSPDFCLWNDCTTAGHNASKKLPSNDALPSGTRSQEHGSSSNLHRFASQSPKKTNLGCHFKIPPLKNDFFSRLRVSRVFRFPGYLSILRFCGLSNWEGRRRYATSEFAKFIRSSDL